jgi:hypothetical protein
MSLLSNCLTAQPPTVKSLHTQPPGSGGGHEQSKRFQTAAMRRFRKFCGWRNEKETLLESNLGFKNPLTSPIGAVLGNAIDFCPSRADL